jgi:Sulfotransferase family
LFTAYSGKVARGKVDRALRRSMLIMAPKIRGEMFSNALGEHVHLDIEFDFVTRAADEGANRCMLDMKETEQKQSTAGPDFLCVGAQKAGTGWLYEQLRLHPDFWMPPLKELHYFDRQWRSERAEKRAKGRVAAARKSARDERDLRFLESIETLSMVPEIDLNKYTELFSPKGGLLSGDITPGYSTLEDELIERIVRQFPDAKTIFLARDPVERAWSHLSMWVRHGSIDPFASNDLEEITRHLLRPEVQLRSYPSRIVARWRRHVNPALFRLYFFDDLKRDPAGLRRSIISFLGGDPEKRSGNLSVGHNPKARLEKLELTDKVRAHIAQFFKEELQACAAELGGPATEWPSRYGF